MNLYFNENLNNYISYSRVLSHPYLSNFRNSHNVVSIYNGLSSEIKESSFIDVEIFYEKILSINKYALNINHEMLNAIRKDLCSTIIDDQQGNKVHLYKILPVEYDYNSFIYHSKSTLDAFFNFIYLNFGSVNRAKRTAKRNAERDRNIKVTDLYIFEVYCDLSNNSTIIQLNQELQVLKNSLFNITERGDRNSLRNILTHKGTIHHNTQAFFSCFKEDDTNRVLLIDADIYGYPLLGTVNNIVASMTYFIMKSLAIILNSSQLTNFNRDDFDAFIDCPLVNFRDYIDENSSDKLQLVVFNNNGFILNEAKVDKERLLLNCIDITSLEIV